MSGTQTPAGAGTSARLHVSTHPLVQSKITQLRLHDLPPKDFREGVKAVGGLMVYEAARDLPLADVPELQSPVASFTGKAVPLRVGLSPILRAGISMTDSALDLFPDATVLHLGLFRDKATLQAIEYYSKLPRNVSADIVYILDPMIATGGTIVAALGMLVEWGLVEEQIKVVSVLGSRQGVQHVQQEYPGVDIWIGAIDEELTDKGYISPGLGDAGDRIFNTETK